MLENIDEIKNKVLPILKESGVSRSSVFGSFFGRMPYLDVSRLSEIKGDTMQEK